MYKSFKNSVGEIDGDFLIIETHWLRTQEKILFMNKVWDSLKPDHQCNQVQILQRLLYHLEVGQATLSSVSNVQDVDATSKLSKSKRFRYAIKVKSSIKKTLEELVKWTDLFDVSYYLVAVEPNHLIDQHLASSQQAEAGTTNPNVMLKNFRDEVQSRSTSDTNFEFLPHTYLLPARDPIMMSTTHIGRLQGGDEVLVDVFKGRKEHDVTAITKDVVGLARVLSKIDPLAFGLFKCRGVCQTFQASEAPTFEFVFEIPAGMSEPRSLRSILMDGSRMPLNEKFALAKSLARSVIYVHMSKFVHKNISPETILLLRDRAGNLGSSFLTGFQSFRFASGMTILYSDDDWKKNLYRHPRRQGEKPEDKYKMHHDIYSMGVVLLEIGLWSSFVVSQSGVEAPNHPDLLEKFQIKNQNERARGVQETLAEIATSKLPYRMGERYKHIVVDCLTCLDDDNSFGDPKEFGEDDTDLGIRYMEHVRPSLLW